MLNLFVASRDKKAWKRERQRLYWKQKLYKFSPSNKWPPEKKISAKKYVLFFILTLVILQNKKMYDGVRTPTLNL